jgi:hypothetical protein
MSLDTAPYDSVAQGNFWKTESDAKQAMMGVYAQMKDQGAFGYMPLWDTYSDIGHGPGSPLEVGTYTAKEDFLVSNWKDTWTGVHRANTVLKNVAGMALDDSAKGPILGEAHFMRALYYFHLVDFFGSVPLYDESWDITEKFMEMLLPRSSAEECWKFIEDDLTEAISLLPVSWPASDYGRATKGAAYALRGKARLFQKKWSGAVEDFEEIVYDKTAAYGYALYPDYYDLFQKPGVIPGNKEEVFTIQNSGPDLGMEFPMIYGTRGTYGSGRATCMPSIKLADMYEMNDGKPFDWEDFIPGFTTSDAVKRTAFEAKLNEKLDGYASVPDTALLGRMYRSRDPRMGYSLIVPYSWYEGYVTDASKWQQFAIASGCTAANGFIQYDRGWRVYLYRKFVPCGDIGGALSDRRHSPVNFSIIRFADVLLMLAEAYNENNETAKAVVEVNKVRARVGMPGIDSGPAWLASGGQAGMRERIRNERAYELAGEGHRFSDIRRWGIAESLLNGRKEMEITGLTLFSRSFESRNNLWPIPSEETINNPKLLPNNPGW